MHSIYAKRGGSVCDIALILNQQMAAKHAVVIQIVRPLHRYNMPVLSQIV